jgi:cysteine desulfurase family protein (TIGR01976 family)
VFPVEELRSLFPAMDGRTVYADAPAGTQVPVQVVEAVSHAMVQSMSNVGGAFAASARSGSVVEAARQAAADLIGGQPSEIVFGPNMTSLTFAISRALAETWMPGDRIVLSGLDHDANVTPWVRAAESKGVEVVLAGIDPDTVTLDLDELGSLIDDRTRLVAVTGCSNAFGSLVDVGTVCAAASAVGALSYVDAVHLAPHRRIDVAGIGCDFLVCSPYKFFGPHLGVLWGRVGLLEQLPAFKVRPAPDEAPGRWETGTSTFELLAGLTAAIDYLASIPGMASGSAPRATRKASLDLAYELINSHETELSRRFLAGLPASAKIFGRPGPEGRVPTFAVQFDGRSPAEAGALLGKAGINVWDGHYYAVEPMRRLGLLEAGGLVRIGFVHINTVEEVERTLDAIADLA